MSSGYFIALASLMLFAGRLAEQVGPRRVFLAGLALYAIGALVMGLAPTVAVLIGARLLQGAGAAALTPVSLAIVLPAFPASRRSTAIGGWAMIGASSGVVAPTVGAVLVDVGGWRLPFLVLTVMLCGVALAAWRVLDTDVSPAAAPAIDLPSVPLVVLSVGGFALALSKVRDWGIVDPRLLIAVVVGSLALPALLFRSARQPGGLLDVGLFRLRSYAAGSVASIFTQIGFFGFFFTAPLFFTEAWEYSVLSAGLALAVQQGVSAVVSVPVGRLADRVGAARIVTAGGLVAAGSFIWMATLVDAQPNFWLAIFPAFVVGGAGAMANGALTTSLALRDVDDATLPRASSGYYVTRRLASGVGVVVGTAILGDAAGNETVARFKLVWIFVAACYAVSALAASRANQG